MSKKRQNRRQEKNVKNSTKTGKNDLQKAQISANLRKFPQKYAETFTISGNCKLIFKSISNNLNAFSRVTKCHLKMTFFFFASALFFFLLFFFPSFSSFLLFFRDKFESALGTREKTCFLYFWMCQYRYVRVFLNTFRCIQ